MAKRTTTRRNQIVRSARRGITRNGYDATTIGDLAAELEISKAAIAYYFPTKDTFLDELLAPMIDGLERAVESAPREPRAVLGAYFDVLCADLEIAVWMDTDPAVLRHPTYGPRVERLNERVVSIVSGASRRKADRLQAVGALGGIWRPVRVSSRSDLVAHRDEILDAAIARSTSPDGPGS